MAALWAFAYPMADDFCRAGWARDRGVVAGVGHEYGVHTGRWAGIGVVYGLSRVASLDEVYWLALLAVAAVSILGWTLLIRQVLGPHVSRGAASFVASSLLLLHWASARPPAESYYWLTGAVENQLSLGLAALVLAGAVAASGRRDPPGIAAVWTCGLATAAFAVTGFHELWGLILVTVLALCATVARWERDAQASRWAVVGLGALIGLAVVVAGPGNAARAAALERREFSAVLPLLLSQGGRHLGSWLLDPRLWAATVALAAPALDLGQERWRVLTRLRYVIPPVLLAFLAGGFIIPGVALSGGIPGRTVNGLHLIFLVGWGLGVLGWRGTLSAWLDARWPGRRMGVAMVAAGLLAVGVVVHGSAPRALLDLVSDARTYRAELSDRARLIRQAVAAGERDVEVPRLRTYARSFVGRGWDITETPDHWRNVCAASFFAVRSLRASPIAP